MILKDMSPGDGQAPPSPHDRGQERVVADQLAQALADDPAVRVFNDLSVAYQGRRTRIDHLVVHPFGIIIIESRSLYGEMRVDRLDGWSRLASGRWVGIPSPLHHVEIQRDILRNLLRTCRQYARDRDTTPAWEVAGSDWTTLCVLPEGATLHGEGHPPALPDRMVMAGGVGHRVRRLMGPRGWRASWPMPRPRRLDSAVLESLSRFLLVEDARLRGRCEMPMVELTDRLSGARYAFPAAITPDFWQGREASDRHLLGCQACGRASHLILQYGRCGHALNCRACGAVTSLTLPCQACGTAPVEVRHSGATFTAHCHRCCYERLLFVAGD